MDKGLEDLETFLRDRFLAIDAKVSAIEFMVARLARIVLDTGTDEQKRQLNEVFEVWPHRIDESDIPSDFRNAVFIEMEMIETVMRSDHPLKWMDLGLPDRGNEILPERE